MTEDFLHYIWLTQNFNSIDLKTISGKAIKVINRGIHNMNSGPDFSDARIFIGDRLWAGNVEIHINSSDWYKHAHEKDEAYQTVILHAVYEHDKEVYHKKGELIETLEFKGLFDEHLYWKYEQLVQGNCFIPCENQLKYLDEFSRISQYDSLVVERLSRKSEMVFEIMEECEGDWNEAFYRFMFFGFGLKVNSQPMLEMAKRIPRKIFLSLRNDLLKVESLLFGMAGMLEEEFDDSYPNTLKSEFEFLRNKYNLVPIEKVNWKFSRMRPSGFPTIRLAQLSQIISKNALSFEDFISSGEVDQMHRLLNVTASEYWNSHYKFNKHSESKPKNTGVDFVNKMIINVVAPFMFYYSEIKNESFYRQRSLDLLDQIKVENNSITRKMVEIGFSNNNSFDSQAILQLYSQYCAQKKCLHCAIGNKLLKG